MVVLLGDVGKTERLPDYIPPHRCGNLTFLIPRMHGYAPQILISTYKNPMVFKPQWRQKWPVSLFYMVLKCGIGIPLSCKSFCFGRSAMANTYKSKIGLELVIPMGLILGGVLVLSALEEPHWLGPLVLLPVIGFIYHLFTTTYYQIDKELLIVKSSFFINLRIDIRTIHAIKETYNPLSSPATSIDRLEIRYGLGKMVLVSPKDKMGFIREIQRINPMVTISFRQKSKP